MFRKIIFWLHLSAGTVAGVVILTMSLTGVLLAFEQQIVRFAERDMRTVEPSPGAKRLDAGALLGRAVESKPGATVAGLTVQADPSQAATVSLGRDGILYMNPYTGQVLGEGSKGARQFFQSVTEWHRWLGARSESRATARAVTGACNAAFLVLAVSGLYLWWPKRWTRPHVAAAALLKSGLTGRARDFNQHNAVGFWSAPVLIVLTATGLVLSYQWAGNLVYTLTGSERPGPPPASQGPPGRSNESKPEIPANLDDLWRLAERQASTWRSIALRLPQRPGAPTTFSIEEGTSPNPFARSQLTVDTAKAEVLKWEPYAEYNLGRKLRVWIRWTHTGEAFGLPGQTVACLASLGGVVLVWTGLSLAVRRFRAWNSRRAKSSASLEPAVSEQ